LRFGRDSLAAEARIKLEAVARDMGFSLVELISNEPKAPRRSATAKYRHPKNAVLVWSGRGRRPKWFIDHLNAGKDPSELAV
jgi:DNA-binding protein H-NS